MKDFAASSSSNEARRSLKESSQLEWKRVLCEVYQHYHSLPRIRGKSFSFFLLFFLTTQRIALIAPECIGLLSKSDSLTSNLLSIFKYAQIYPLFESLGIENSRINLLIIFLGINFLFIVCSILMMIDIYFFKSYQKIFFIRMRKCIKIAVSVLFAIYNYTIVVSAISLSLEMRKSNDHQILANLTLISTAMIGVIIQTFDFNIEYIQQDFLGRRPSIWGMFQLLRDIFLCGISIHTSKNIIIIYAIVSAAAQLTEFALDSPYSDLLLKKGFIASGIIVLLASIEVGVFDWKDIEQGWFLLFSVSVPLAWVLATKIFENFTLLRFYSNMNLVEEMGNFEEWTSHGQKIIKAGKSQRNLHKRMKTEEERNASKMGVRDFEFLVQFLHDDIQAYEGYVESKDGRGIFTEIMILNHAEHCEDEKCFCQGFTTIKEGTWSNDDFVGEMFRKDYMNKLILHLFRKFLDENQNSKDQSSLSIRILYLSFIVDVYKAPTKCFTELLDCYSMRKQFGWREFAMLETVKSRIEAYFLNVLLSTNLENQKSDSLICVQFDEVLAEIEGIIRYVSPQYHAYLELLLADSINLEELEHRGSQFIDIRNQIESKINIAFLLNSESKHLHEQVAIFSENFDFKERSPSDFKKLTFSQRRFKASLKIPSQLFSDQGSVVFMTVCKPVGIFKKISNNFPLLLEQDSQDIIGKSINYWLPGNVASQHDAILRIFVETGSWNYISRPFSQLFFVNKRKFLVPVDVTFKLDYMKADEDFGVTGFIRQRIEQRDFITFHRSGKIADITEQLFYSFFERKMRINFESVGKIDLYKLVPMLGLYQLFDAMKKTPQLNEEARKRGIEWKMYFILPKLRITDRLFFKPSQSTDSVKTMIRNYVRLLKPQSCAIYSAPDLYMKSNPILNGTASFDYVAFSNLVKVPTVQERALVLSQLLEAIEFIEIAQDETNDVHLTPEELKQKQQQFQLLQKAHSERTNKDESSKRFQSSTSENYNESSFGGTSRGNISGIYSSKSSSSSRSETSSEENGDDEGGNGKQSEGGLHSKKGYGIVTTMQSKMTLETVHKIPEAENDAESSKTDKEKTRQDELIQSQQFPSPLIQSQVFGSSGVNNFGKFERLSSTIQRSDSQLQNISPPLQQAQPSQQQQKQLAFEVGNFLTSGTLGPLGVDMNPLINTDSYANTKRGLLTHNEDTYRESISLLLTARDGTQKGESTEAGTKLTAMQKPKLNILKASGSQSEKHFFKQSSTLQLNQSQSNQEIGNTIPESNNLNNFSVKVASQFKLPEEQVSKSKSNKKDNQYKKQKHEKRKRLKEKLKQKKHSHSTAHRSKSQLQSDRILQEQQQHLSSSINSSKTANYSKKKEIIRQIMFERKDNFMKSIQQIGFILLAILITVSTVLFQLTMTTFSQEVSTFEDIPYAVSVRADYSIMIRNQELDVILRNDLFGFLSNPTASAQVDSLLTELAADSQEKFAHYNKMFNYYYEDTKLTGLKAQMLSSEFQIKVYREDGSFFNKQTSLHEAFTFVQENLYEYMMYGIQRSYAYNNIQQNTVIMMEQYTKLQDAVVSESLLLLDDIQKFLNLSLIVIVSMSSVMILTLFPLFSKVQGKREDILKLYATFDPVKIEPLVVGIEFLMRSRQLRSKRTNRYQNNNVTNVDITRTLGFTGIPTATATGLLTTQFGGNRNNTNNYNYLLDNRSRLRRKKKTISSTTNLKKFNIGLIISGLLIAILICAYPILNIFIFDAFIQESKYSIQEMNSLYSARAQVTSVFSANYMAMSDAIKDDGPIDDMKLIRVQSLSQTNKNRLSDIKQIFDNFSGSRYSDAEYRGFFLPILNEDICGTFAKYPQYISSESPISDKCKTESSGILLKGLYIALQFVFGRFEEVLPALENKSTRAKFTSDVRLWASTFDFFDFNETYNDLISVIENMRYFMIQITDQYFSYIKKTSTYLFMMCLAGMLLGFTICWMKFFSFIETSLNRTRRTITALRIGSILDNPYFLSFLSSELKK